MRTFPSKRHSAGYVSFLLVLSIGSVLSLLMIYSFRRAMNSQAVQKQVQLRVDYSEKEEAILRSIVAITPNRAIRAMQHESNLNGTNSTPLRWENIFQESLVLANARTSISAEMVSALNIPGLKVSNAGDSALNMPSRIFTAISPEAGFVSTGLNRSLGAGYPAPLSCTDTVMSGRDAVFPIIARSKVYNNTLAQTYLDSVTLNGNGTVAYGLPANTYSGFNRLKYPNINFGYAKPGDPFVAKRNWWAFSLNVAAHDDDKTYLAKSKRDFVLSIYEIPTQLGISASSFMSLGQYASGDAWQNVKIDGGMFVGKADVVGDTDAINSLASRRGMTLSSNSSVGNVGAANLGFAPGVREQFLKETQGGFFPVSLASESGRAAFVPINTGTEFFDRHFHSAESNVLSSTTWKNYSSGALQCAMQLDISQVVKSTNPANITPTHLRFSCLRANGTRLTLNIQLSSHPPGYYPLWLENESYNFGTDVVDVAYGLNGSYAYKLNQSGSVSFSNANFGDPLVGTLKKGYMKLPFEISGHQPDGRTCVAVYPQRFRAFLKALGADTTAVNHSLVVNVDYKTSIGSTFPTNPLPTTPPTPYLPTDYGVILRECADLTSFTKGFSLVTNMRLYIGDDFNVVPTPPPAGYTPPITPTNPTGRFMPPCSLFSPEKRYGVDVDPFAVSLGGQIGSLASDTVTNAIRPLDSKTVSGNMIDSSRITVNLSQIHHPVELPPITMMNWLILLEERRKEFQ